MTTDADAPIEGQILLLTAAKASVGPERLPDLVAQVQTDLQPRLEEYERRYELVHETSGSRVFLAERGHWETVGERLGLDRREVDAVRRAHTEQFRRFGRREDRRDEFEAALDIRDPVVVGVAREE